MLRHQNSNIQNTSHPPPTPGPLTKPHRPGEVAVLMLYGITSLLALPGARLIFQLLGVFAIQALTQAALPTHWTTTA